MSEKYAFWVTIRPKMASQTTTEQGKAEQCIFNFKTTWSEFQKPSQTTTERGEAEQCIPYFKTTWSEFQKPNQTKPSCVYLILKSHGQPSYVYTILKKHHLPKVGPKQLCALAHLGCTRAATTS